MDMARHLAIATAVQAEDALDATTIAAVLGEIARAQSDPGLAPWYAPGRLSRDAVEHIVDRLETASADTPRQQRVRPAISPPTERYQLVRVLGRGGMGLVEERLDNRIGRRIAFKTVLPDVPDRQRALLMLRREAQVTGNLEHPNIIPVYDVGEDDQGDPYYVMRVADHASLEDVIARLALRDPAAIAEFGLVRLLRVFSQVCNAIEYAHSRGFAHHDLKPANILLGAFGQVLVVDWGIATALGERAAYLAGTPGYLAPELVLAHEPVDPRSDIFALGAVLYDILCQRPALAHSSVEDLVRSAAFPAEGFRVVSPRSIATLFVIDEDLDAICLRALSPDRETRFASVAALGKAIDEVIEGTHEKERRMLRAAEMVALGDDLAQGYLDLDAERPRRVLELVALRASIPPFAPPEEKQVLWDAEDGFAVLETLRVRTLQNVIAQYESALAEVPDHEGARAGLARVYAAELRRAEDARDDFDRLHFDERLRQVTGGAALPDARLDVEAGGFGAEVSLERFEPEGRRLVPVEKRSLGKAPVKDARLPQGSYLVQVGNPGELGLVTPVLLRAGEQLKVTVDLLAAADLDEDEAIIPGGLALLGDALDLELREVNVPTFIVQRAPVTFARYLEFVAELAQADTELAEPRLPVADDGEPLFAFREGKLVPASVTRFRVDFAKVSRLPAVGVDAASVEAYASWLSEKTGRGYRLPTEDEWEKAGRGVDGRAYPWGDKFDASYCKMRDSRPGVPRPEPSAAFALDRSVYGVVDMAGGVADWVMTTARDARVEDATARYVSRGGAYCDSMLDCRLTARRNMVAEEHSARVGFRLVRTVASRAAMSVRTRA